MQLEAGSAQQRLLLPPSWGPFLGPQHGMALRVLLDSTRAPKL